MRGFSIILFVFFSAFSVFSSEVCEILVYLNNKASDLSPQKYIEGSGMCTLMLKDEEASNHWLEVSERISRLSAEDQNILFRMKMAPPHPSMVAKGTFKDFMESRAGACAQETASLLRAFYQKYYAPLCQQ